MQDCLFCKIIKGEVSSFKVYEDDKVYAFLDINPVNPGHTLVIPKEHCSDYSQTPDEVLADLMVKVKKIAEGVKKSVEALDYNLVVNVGAIAGQVIFHTHIHIIPRFENDSHKHWKGEKEYKVGEADELAKRIQKNI